MYRDNLTIFTFGSLIVWSDIAARLWSVGHKTLYADIWNGVFFLLLFVLVSLWWVEADGFS